MLILTLRKVVVLELLFSAGLVAALRSLEPRKLITCPGFAVGHRLIIGAKGHSGTPKTVALSPILCNFWLLDVPIRALDGPPPTTGGLPNSSAIMAATLLALRVPLPSYTFICPPHPLSASRHILLPQQSTPLYLSTVWPRVPS